MSSRLADLIVANRWMVLLLVALTTVFAAAQLRNLRFDFTVQALFAGEEEELEFSKQFNDTFAHENNVLVVILEATGTDDVLTPQAIDWQTNFANQLEAIPQIESVVGLSTVRVPRVRLIGRSRIMMVPIVRPDRATDEKEAKLVRAKVADTPMLDGMLISKDRQCAAVVAYLDAEVNEVREVRGVVADAEEIFARLPVPDGYQLHVTGLPRIRLDISERLKGDQTFIIPICAGLFMCILLLMYRRISGLLIPGIAITVAVIWTLAILVLFDQPLNIVNNVLPPMLMIVGISNCVHVVSYFSEQTLLTPDDRLGIARRTLRHMIPACLLACATTAVGFLSLLVADAEVLFSFGWQSGVGMICIFLSTILVTGGLMPFLRAPKFSIARQTSGNHNDRENSPLARLAASMGGFATSHPLFVISATLWIMLGALVLSQNVLVDSKLIDTYDKDDQVVRTIDLAEDKLGGFMPLELSLTCDDPTKFQDPDIFFRVARAATFLQALPEVTLVRSYVDLCRQLDRTLPGKPRFQEDKPTEEVDETSETSRRLAEIHGHLSRPSLRSSNSGGGDSRYRAYLAEDGTHARISVHLRDIGIRQNEFTCATIEEQLASIFPRSTGITIRMTGDAYYSSRALRKLINDLFYSLMGAALVIFVVIAVLFRSVRLAIAAVLPNVIPLIITLGYIGLMAWSGFENYAMNTGIVIVFAISLGIAVDDTIHFIARFRDETEQGGTIDEIIRRTCLGTGKAIIMTSCLIVIGLSVIHFSDFVPTRRFAELTSVTMCAALLGDLLLLPACLKLVWPKDSTTRSQPDLRVVGADVEPARAAS